MCIGGCFMLSFCAIGFKLVEIGLHPKSEATLKAIAAMPQHNPQNLFDAESVPVAIDAEKRLRGDIVDRNGVVLATSLSTASLFADAREVKNPGDAAKKLVKLFPEVGHKKLLKELSSGKSFVWLKRNLTPIEQHKVNNLGIPGLYFQPEVRRVYPHGALFSHVLGYVGVDNRGLAGVEKTFDKRLLNDEENNEPLQLSLDMRIQNIVREELQKAVKEFQAIGATGVVLDIKTGEIISMANLPDFDPHQPGKAKDISKFNRATLGVYEMGSTFKTFTVAAALHYGVAGMRDGYDASRPIKISRFTISDTHPKKRWLSVPEIFAYSSNIGTVRMVLDLGTNRQRDFLKKLGMFKSLDLELPEMATPLSPNPWREINTMTISYGHGLAVTPMHLVRGIATLVGDGREVGMTLVKGGNAKKKQGDQVVTENTSLMMRKLMRMVVQHGTASRADVQGYRVGGKTGTAEKVQAGGRYNDHAKLASFVGVFPTDKPQYVVLVMIDEPRGNKSTYGYATGGWVSAPVVGRIVSRMGPMMGISPIFDVENKTDPYWFDTEKKQTHAVAY